VAAQCAPLLLNRGGSRQAAQKAGEIEKDWGVIAEAIRAGSWVNTSR